ncbi:MAG: hypothetical protein WCJ55_20100, partial [Chloroflexales bacterium]
MAILLYPSCGALTVPVLGMHIFTFCTAFVKGCPCQFCDDFCGRSGGGSGHKQKKALPQKTFMRGAHTAAMNMVADARLSAIGYRLSAIFTSVT